VAATADAAAAGTAGSTALVGKPQADSFGLRQPTQPGCSETIVAR
jgi:hypothetical protein